MLFPPTDLRHYFQCIFYEEKSRDSTWYLLSTSRLEHLKQSYFSGWLKCKKFYCLNKDVVSRFPYFFILAVPNHFRYSVCSLETGSLTHRHRRLLTQKRICSPAYNFTVGTNNAVKCYIIAALIWLDYLQSSVFISINQTQMKWRSPKRHLNFQICSGKSWPHRAASNYLYLFGLCIFSLLFFKQWFCNGPETEMKGTIGITENI